VEARFVEVLMQQHLRYSSGASIKRLKAATVWQIFPAARKLIK
jgi:hypothetical protein